MVHTGQFVQYAGRNIYLVLLVQAASCMGVVIVATRSTCCTRVFPRS